MPGIDPITRRNSKELVNARERGFQDSGIDYQCMIGAIGKGNFDNERKDWPTVPLFYKLVGIDEY